MYAGLTKICDWLLNLHSIAHCETTWTYIYPLPYIKSEWYKAEGFKTNIQDSKRKLYSFLADKDWQMGVFPHGYTNNTIFRPPCSGVPQSIWIFYYFFLSSPLWHRAGLRTQHSWHRVTASPTLCFKGEYLATRTAELPITAAGTLRIFKITEVIGCKGMGYRLDATIPLSLPLTPLSAVIINRTETNLPIRGHYG